MNLMDASFVPAEIDASDWSQIQPLLEELKTRDVLSPAEFEQWLIDRSELQAACSESRARLYITMSCNTDNAAANAAYTKYVESIPPRLSPVEFELDRKHVALSRRFELDPVRYEVLNRSKKASVELFREENVPLQTDLSKLTQEFDRIAGAQTVQFEDREQTLPQMARYLEVPDRARREAAWRTIAARRHQDRGALNSVYDKMIAMRHKVATNAGFKNYVDYVFLEKERFDYTPRDCQAYWNAVEKHVVPLMRKLDERRRVQLGAPVLRPWDLGVDVKGRPALRPFEGGKDLLRKTIGVFAKLDPRLAGMVKQLADESPAQAPETRDAAMRTDCLDLDTRKGKRPGGYQYMRDRSRKPFIFMNAAGLQRDVMTMIHEAGHAFHSMLCSKEPLVEYRHSPIEFAEVASMSMEHLTMPHWGGPESFYASPEDLTRARHTHLEDCITILAWIATIDAFQHWIYTNPGHTPQQRDAYWLTLDARFGRGVSWEPGPDGPSGQGLTEFRASAWQKQSHLFSHPMYYIEYGIAQLGSLQLWLRSKNEGPAAAIDGYVQAMSLGGSRPLPTLFEAAGLRFDFGEETVKSIVGSVSEELGEMDP
ncbi:MAG: M3 family oligoendopeptidase [Pyrinomonadaceae bacterium]|nr:M3 family oligoendopeptidase [Phycisphaerales bacterium]